MPRVGPGVRLLAGRGAVTASRHEPVRLQVRRTAPNARPQAQKPMPPVSVVAAAPSRVKVLLTKSQDVSSFEAAADAELNSMKKAELAQMRDEVRAWEMDAHQQLLQNKMTGGDEVFNRWSLLDHKLSESLRAPDSGTDVALDTARLMTGRPHASTVEHAVAGLPAEQAQIIRQASTDAAKAAHAQQEAARESALVDGMLSRTGLCRLDVPRDGNCLFNAYLKTREGPQGNSSPTTLRHELMDRLDGMSAEKRAAIFQVDLADAAAAKNRADARLAAGTGVGDTPITSTAWGENDDIALLAATRNKDVVCFSGAGATLFRPSGERVDYPADAIPHDITANRIAIVHQGNHFQATDPAVGRIRELVASLPFETVGTAANAANDGALMVAWEAVPPVLKPLAVSLNHMTQTAKKFEPLTANPLVVGSMEVKKQYDKWELDLSTQMHHAHGADREELDADLKHVKEERAKIEVDLGILRQLVANPGQLPTRFIMITKELAKASNEKFNPADPGRRERLIASALTELETELQTQEARIGSALAELKKIRGTDIHTGAELKRDKQAGNHIHDPEIHRLAAALEMQLLTLQASFRAPKVELAKLAAEARANPTAMIIAFSGPRAATPSVPA